MTRQRKTSAFEDLVEVLARLPWWACVALALLSYAVLSRLAVPVPITVNPGQIGAAITQSVWKAFAAVGQYLLPMACIFAAIFSLVGQAKRRRLAANVTHSPALDALNEMTWREFEMLVGEAFRLQGYQVVELGGDGPDGGVDLVLRKEREKFLVQCKQWKATRVGVQVVRELFGVMAAEGAAGGFVVTSGTFTAEATAFAEGRNVKLLDGPALRGLLHQAKVARAGSGRPAARAEPPPVSAAAAGSEASFPACPLCAQAMVRRVAKRGANAGGKFWGCSGYPICKGTRAG